MGVKSNSLLYVVVIVQVLYTCHGYAKGKDDEYGVNAMYQFGDSISDTGNIVYDSDIGVYSPCNKLPYGQTYFHRATGRCSDGLLIVDYFARHFKLPFLDPYLKKDGNFTHGANFAVAGATALDISTLASQNITGFTTNSSLSMQIEWFRDHLKSICDSSSDCKSKLQNAWFIMGEIGGNDIGNALLGGKSLEEARNLLPRVIQTIIDAVKEVIGLGAIRVMVPGNFPIGCMPIYLASFESKNMTKYDEFGCLKHLNNFSKYQNKELQRAIRELQKEYPHVAIVYGDYFHALRNIIRFPSSLGFDRNTTLKACCGDGDNPYNYNMSRSCGFNGVQVCSNVGTRVSWDGIHLTSHAYKYMSKSLFKQIIHGISHVHGKDSPLGAQHKETNVFSFILSFVIRSFIKVLDLF